MASFNKCILVGNLTRDPEQRYTPKGTCVVQFGLAVNRKWKTEGGEEREDVTFVDVDAFGRTAEVIAQYCSKGDPILIEGRLKLDQWDDKHTNQKRSKLKVICESFQFLNKAVRDEEEGAGDHNASRAPAKPATRQQTAREAAKSSPDYPETPIEDQDVPFSWIPPMLPWAFGAASTFLC